MMDSTRFDVNVIERFVALWIMRIVIDFTMMSSVQVNAATIVAALFKEKGKSETNNVILFSYFYNDDFFGGLCRGFFATKYK